MLGIILQESIEISVVAIKLVIRTARCVYRTFMPQYDQNLIEMQDLKKRVDSLEKIIQMKDS